MGYPVKFLIFAAAFLLKPFFVRVMFSKGLYRCLTAGKKIRISTTLLSIHNVIIITTTLFLSGNSYISVFRRVENLCSRICFSHHAIWPHVTIFIFNCSLSVHVITNENYWTFHPSGIYLLKVNNKNTRTRFEICWKLTIKTPEIRQRTSFWSLYY